MNFYTRKEKRMITPRLEMILRHISGDSCADIGTDHCYVPIKLAEKGVRVIATDIAAGPLKMAEKHTKKYGKNIELRIGNGLDPIKAGETDTIVIAGMGGEMIEKIISEEPDKAHAAHLVIQPMNGQYELRRFLAENNFRIVSEDIAVEGFKVYNLIEAVSGKGDTYEKEIDAHLPKSLRNNENFMSLLEKKKREFTRIYNGLAASAVPKEAEITRYKNLLDEIARIEAEQRSEKKEQEEKI